MTGAHATLGRASAACCRHEIVQTRYEMGGNKQPSFNVLAASHVSNQAAPPPISTVIPSRREPEERW
jgi:hypothetical protein